MASKQKPLKLSCHFILCYFPELCSFQSNIHLKFCHYFIRRTSCSRLTCHCVYVSRFHLKSTSDNPQYLCYKNFCSQSSFIQDKFSNIYNRLSLILPRSRTGTVWFYTSTSNKRAARPKLYTKSLTRDLKPMYSRFTLLRISIKLQAPHFFYIGTGVSLLFRERFLYI